MKILRGLNQRITEATVATIGTFDGVHLGHQKIINETLAAAKSTGKKSALITFDRHPKETLDPHQKIQALITIETKISLFAQFNPDLLILLGFTPSLANFPPEAFCHEILVEKVNIAHLFVGENFRFGYKAAGDTRLLERYGQEHGFEVTSVPLLEIDSTVVSSTKIREMVQTGEVDKIPLLLGRFHFVTGVVVKGAGRGIGLGFPTANLELDGDLCLPREGVYAGYFWLRDEPLPAAINVGSNPTFGPGASHVEAYIFNFSQSIYGEHVRVELQKFLRREAKFASVDALAKQIGRDVKQARELLASSKPTGWLNTSSLSQ